ncbi:MAG TPA: methionyl-tRNA formyltransferase, partial [Bacteroidales bacterium]|nr:methionyl-tRNA formyltransferase [Bacteroidales bacterium]
MGTPDFAVEPLAILLKNGYLVKAVVTALDKPAGRGLKNNESAVKKFATSQGIPILQPISLKEETFIHELKHLNPDVIIVVAFRMLPEEVWGLPSRGTINLHASLLPQYRGAAPINWAIING